jgi:signal transduction histidine kinase
MEFPYSHSILIVDDEESVTKSLKRLLRKDVHEIVTAASGMEGLQRIREAAGPFSLVISDQRMPGMTGVRFLEKVKKASPHSTRVLLTGVADMQTIIDAVNEGEIHRYVTKPWNDGEMVTMVRQAVEQFEKALENRQSLFLTRKRNEELDKLNKNLEERLLQAQKMEAIGTLAGGIAHDFNNILSAIFGYAELALIRAPKESQQYVHLQGVIQASHRAKELVKQILTFSRQHEHEKKPVQITPIVKESLKFLRVSLPANIQIREHIKDGAGIIMADPTEIHRVLMNLCTNAFHAMSAKGGILDVEICSIEVNEDFAAQNPDLSAGNYLRLTVSDTGCGMKSDVLARIFDPYFSTKAKEHGTGLGLSVVHGIVKSHGGAITVYSEPDRGTTFRIYFPAVEAEIGVRSHPDDSVPTGGERILFVDDEKAITNVSSQILKRLGYKVEARTNSVEALELFRSRPDLFDLVITDLTMPNMTGDELARELTLIRPDIPIILCSGFSTGIIEKNSRPKTIRAVLMKPLVLHQMAKVIREVLEGNQNPRSLTFCGRESAPEGRVTAGIKSEEEINSGNPRY